MATTPAAIFDLDRTVLRGSSAPAIQRHLKAAGLASHDFPGEELFQTTYRLFGESSLAMAGARLTSGAKAGWKIADVAVVAEAIADELMDDVMPFVPYLIEKHKAEGCTLVLATGSNQAAIQALADRLGFDEVIATKWAVDGDTYTGELDGPRLLGPGKKDAVVAWSAENDIDLAESYFYTDSRFDADLLELVGHPIAVNPDVPLAIQARLRGWQVRHLDAPEGVVKIAGRELQEWARVMSVPQSETANARFEVEGIENVPTTGGAILVFNHRSYFDGSAVGLVLSTAGRNARFLGKKEVFDIPVAGAISKAMGGIRVDRGTGSNEPLEKAAEALAGGDLVAIAPQGTIPRGPAFFEPELKGRWGAARLAKLAGVPVIPVALWGTEKVWPRSERLPWIPRPGQDKPVVTVKIGPAFKVTSKDPDVGTRLIMKKIMEQLPPEAHERHEPTEKELLKTFPAGYDGDPNAESDRRPGTDT